MCTTCKDTNARSLSYSDINKNFSFLFYFFFFDSCAVISISLFHEESSAFTRKYFLATYSWNNTCVCVSWIQVAIYRNMISLSDIYIFFESKRFFHLFHLARVQLLWMYLVCILMDTMCVRVCFSLLRMWKWSDWKSES